MPITIQLTPAAKAISSATNLARIRCRQTLPDWQQLTDPATQPDGPTLPLALIDHPDCDELWSVDEAVDYQQIGPIHCRRSARYRFCWLWFDPYQTDTDTDTDTDSTAVHPFNHNTYRVYDQILRSLQHGPHQHLLKIWHYLPAINRGHGDDEHYRQFCLGRARALTQHQHPEPLPAATAIGIPDPAAPALFYWLSATQPGSNLENPRQTQAWRYPRQYGPARPNFSRATLSADSQQFFISGTASVVGHHTTHPHRTAAQTREMLANLSVLLQTARQRHAAIPELTQLDGPLRLYLRDPADWPDVQQALRQADFPLARAIACRGDICRDDLMVELDGVQGLNSC